MKNISPKFGMATLPTFLLVLLNKPSLVIVCVYVYMRSSKYMKYLFQFRYLISTIWIIVFIILYLYI